MAMQHTLHYIPGRTLTLNDKQSHAIRLQLVRLEAWVQKQRGVSRDSFVCEMIKFFFLIRITNNKNKLF